MSQTRKFFYLKPAATAGTFKGKSLLMFSYFAADRKRFKLSTKIYISPKHWNDSLQRVIPQTPGATEYNVALERFVTSITALVAEMRADGLPVTAAGIRARYLESGERKQQAEYDQLFIPFVRDAIGTKNSVGRLQAHLSANTLKTYKTLLNQIEEMEKLRRLPLRFNDFNQRFFSDFTGMLQSRMNGNTVNKLCKILKVLLRLAVREGRTDYREFEKAKIDVKRVEPVTMYLTDSEIRAIYNLRSDKKILAREDANLICREADRIVLGCQLGLRISDFLRIGKENVYERSGTWYLTLTTKKTSEPVVIPLRPLALEILRRYDFTPPKISAPKANKHMKRICELAGIVEPITTPEGVKPKYELITTHTMRRSFATNLIRDGVPHHLVMKLGGWKSLATFERYIRFSREQAAERVAEIFAGKAGPSLSIAHIA